MTIYRFVAILFALLVLVAAVLQIALGDSVKILRLDRANALVFLLLFSASVIFYIGRAKKDPHLFIRKLAGLDAVDEAVGRATEMGKSILFVPGIQDLDDIQTIAGLSILSKVAAVTAEYDTPLLVPILYPLAFAAGQETVKQAYINAGKSES